MLLSAMDIVGVLLRCHEYRHEADWLDLRIAMRIVLHFRNLPSSTRSFPSSRIDAYVLVYPLSIDMSPILHLV